MDFAERPAGVSGRTCFTCRSRRGYADGISRCSLIQCARSAAARACARSNPGPAGYTVWIHPDQRKLVWTDMRGRACALRMRGGLSADRVVKHRETCSTACLLVVTRKCLKFRRATCIRNSQFRHYILYQSLDSTAWVCGWWPTRDITTGLKARCNDETESGNNIISGLNKPFLVFSPPNLAS